MLSDKDVLKDLFKKDEAIKYLKPIRGTPPYWQSTQKDVMAMIRQLGIPTYFCSFSAADFRWTEFGETILKQQGDCRRFEDLEWTEKCKILCSNPVTLARMFDQRFHTFLRNVIMSEAEPIGKVKDYFYRVEFQQRGSPHTHCLIWIENAPKFNEDSIESVVSFINKYITCEIPDKDSDPELHDIVTTVQQHSKNHSKSCKKKGTACRFNFPRPPSEQTFIAQTGEYNETDVKISQQKLEALWDVVSDSKNENMTAADMLLKAGLTQQNFEKIFSVVTKRNTVVLQRKPRELFINQYNPHLLRAWNANIDIQFVLDAYSCVVYIISYISKAERELGLLLQQTRNEASEGNLDAQKTMRRVGTAYLHHREVSAQEAVFRVTGLRLKECSRKVEFIPIGQNPCRLSIPLKDLEKRRGKNLDDDENDDDIWMTSTVDRYKGRPMHEMFNKMSLAQFSSDFSVVVESQLPKTINEETTFKLEGDLGYIRKRTKTSPAVIRYPRFSLETSREKYYHSILQLYLPYRRDQQLKPPSFETYEDFYRQGFIKFPGEKNLVNVKQVVDENMSIYVKNGNILDAAEKQIEEQGPQDDAWGQLCPEKEVERKECIDEGSKCSVIEEEHDLDSAIPDLNMSNRASLSSSNILRTNFHKNDIVPLLRNLNEKQRKIFYKIREWCISKANGQNVEPFHVLITGGAGTGKSHLIKCIHYEASRILQRISENPDDLVVLLTAPTGTAAFNINGMTIHSALGIFKTLSADHATLSEDKINSLRSKLESLHILIVDEISMVNKRLLFFIHQRLRQIKKKPENCVFGGVSVIAVGDFYQLPPVRTKRSDKLYVNDLSNPLNYVWSLFSVVELTEIMRQKEDALFAELLNRIRVKPKHELLEKPDLQVLKQCIRDGPDHVLHIFATNDEVHRYNNEMIMKVCTEQILVEAEDFEKDKASGKLSRRKINYSKLDIHLPSAILLAEGARVMLIKNEDVQDGLVNGVMGTVMEIKKMPMISMPEVIFINFDNMNVGKNSKLQKNINGQRCVGLKPSSEDIPIKSGLRKQYPLQLAWGCTIHKVQGLTVDECVVNLSKNFASGQSYVALSRVTSKAGLYITPIDDGTLDKKIFCDQDIADGLSSMSKFLPVPLECLEDRKEVIKIMYHNIQGLRQHEKDLQCNSDFRDADYICLAETWLDTESVVTGFENYAFLSLARSDAFSDADSYYLSLKALQHGGVGVFYRRDVGLQNIEISCNLECLVFIIPHVNVVVATIYRTQKYQMERFMINFKKIVSRIELLSDRVIIIGDFNENIKEGQGLVSRYMTLNGFQQLVKQGTTEGGSIIDHVYAKGCDRLEVSVMPTYYSYHEAIKIGLKVDL